jgi:hypothetical protein
VISWFFLSSLLCHAGPFFLFLFIFPF